MIYNLLSEMKGWTFDQIAHMTRKQQLAALGQKQSSSDIIKFRSIQEARAWASANRTK